MPLRCCDWSSLSSLLFACTCDLVKRRDRLQHSVSVLLLLRLLLVGPPKTCSPAVSPRAHDRMTSNISSESPLTGSASSHCCAVMCSVCKTQQPQQQSHSNIYTRYTHTKVTDRAHSHASRKSQRSYDANERTTRRRRVGQQPAAAHAPILLCMVALLKTKHKQSLIVPLPLGAIPLADVVGRRRWKVSCSQNEFESEMRLSADRRRRLRSRRLRRMRQFVVCF